MSVSVNDFIFLSIFIGMCFLFHQIFKPYPANVMCVLFAIYLLVIYLEIDS